MNFPAWPPTITLDQFSIVLFVLIIIVTITHGIRSRPQPSMYPMPLGMQSELARVRRKNESPIFRNTMAMFPSSPKRSIETLRELIQAADGTFHRPGDPNERLPRQELKTLVARARVHLWSILNNTPDLNGGLHPRLLLVISNPYFDLIFSLAAATLPCTTLHISVPPSHSIPAEVQRACLSGLPHIALVVCDPELQEAVKDWTSGHCQPNILTSFDVDWFTSPPPSDEKDSAIVVSQEGLFKMLHLSESTEKKTESYFVIYTPQCLLAGVTAVLALFPLANGFATSDRVAIQLGMQPLWGFEAAIAIAATYAGAQVCYFKTTDELSDWYPTVLVCRGEMLENLAEQIRKMAANWSFKLSIARNLAYLSDGILGEKITHPRIRLARDLHSIFTRGPITQSSANVLRAGLGTTVQQVYAHHLVAGPILATQSGDFQSLGTRRSLLHYGPPTVNIECKVVNVAEPAVLNSDAVKGQLAVKGPAVTTKITDTQTGQTIETHSASEGFMPLSQEAQLLTNGTVRILPPDLPWDQ